RVQREVTSLRPDLHLIGVTPAEWVLTLAAGVDADAGRRIPEVDDHAPGGAAADGADVAPRVDGEVRARDRLAGAGEGLLAEHRGDLQAVDVLPAPALDVVAELAAEGGDRLGERAGQ